MASALQLAALVSLGEARLLEIRAELAEQFAFGRTVVSASFGDSSSSVFQQKSPAEALNDIQQALTALNPDVYPAIVRDTRRRVTFAPYPGGQAS